VSDLLDRLRYRRQLRRMAGPKLLRAFADAYPEAFFVEIGANDGEKYDHLRSTIRSRGWAGIMVEPVPYVFERLAQNYRDVDQVILEHAAIADRDGNLPLWSVRPPEPGESRRLPDWYDAIGSFSRETVLSHAPQIPDIEDRLIRLDVPTLTFASLCAKHGIEEVDLLVIDTEGYDHEILRSIDFTGIRPRLVIYEHFHLAPEERAGTAELMREAGYETMEEDFDTFCLDPGSDPGLVRTWRRLRPAVPGASKHDEVP
jgi:FkbM family methyltransferase